MPRFYVAYLGRILVRFILAIHGLGAFALITFGVLCSKFGAARQIVHPLILLQVARSGLRLLPLAAFLALALGLVVIGQTVSLLASGLDLLLGVDSFLGAVKYAFGLIEGRFLL
jgi:hypothetical protein